MRMGKRTSAAHGLPNKPLPAGLLAAAEGAVGPDAELIQACEECLSARASCDSYGHASRAPRLEKETRADLKAKATVAYSRCQELEAWIVATPASTAEGARAKLRCAVDLGASWKAGMLALPCAAMEDALRLLR